MLTLMLKRYWISTISCVVLAAAPLFAQTSPKSAASSDMEAWRTYKLTMPKVDEWAAANRKAEAYMKAHPKVQENKDDATDAQTVAEIEKRIKADAPGLIEAMETSGLSFRDWWNLNIALTMAYVAVQTEKMGSPAPKYVLPENIAFVKANQQKIAALLAEEKKLQGQGKQ